MVSTDLDKAIKEKADIYCNVPVGKSGVNLDKIIFKKDKAIRKHFTNGARLLSDLEVLAKVSEVKELLNFYFKGHDNEWIETSIGGAYHHTNDCRKCKVLEPWKDALSKVKDGGICGK